jgi:hypothetical protein
MRRLRAPQAEGERPAWIDDLFARFREARIEEWNEARWEAFALSALWEACREGVRLAGGRESAAVSRVRHRDLLCAVGGADSDLLVNDVLIRFCAAFLDGGIAHCAAGASEVCSTLSARCTEGGRASAWWTTGLPDESDGTGGRALASIQDSLAPGCGARETEEYLSATLLALRGWAAWSIVSNSAPTACIGPCRRAVSSSSSRCGCSGVPGAGRGGEPPGVFG